MPNETMNISEQQTTEQEEKQQKLREQQLKELDDQKEQLEQQQDDIKKLKRRNVIMAVISLILLIIFIIICTFKLYRRYDEKIVYDKPVETDSGQTPITDDRPSKDDNQTQTPTKFDGSGLKKDEYGFYISTDETGKRVLLDSTGTVIEVDEKGVPIIYDQNGKRIPTDENGKLIVYDENNNRIPLDKICEKVFRDRYGRAIIYSGKRSGSNENDNGEDNQQSSDGKGHFSIYSVGDVYTADNGRGLVKCDIRNTDDSTHDIVASLYISREEMESHGISTGGMDGDRWLIAQTGIFEPGYQINNIQLLALPDGSYLGAGSYALTMNERYYHHETGVLSSYEANIPVTLEVAD